MYQNFILKIIIITINVTSEPYMAGRPWKKSYQQSLGNNELMTISLNCPITK